MDRRMKIHDPMETVAEMEKRAGRRDRKKDLEAAVLRECLLFLRLHERVVYIERRNTGAVQFEDGGFIKFGTKGAADIWCLIRKPMFATDAPDNDDDPLVFMKVPVAKCHLLTHVEIECKRRSGGRLSQSQREFRDFCGRVGISYFVVTSVEDLSKQLHDAGFTA